MATVNWFTLSFSTLKAGHAGTQAISFQQLNRSRRVKDTRKRVESLRMPFSCGITMQLLTTIWQCRRKVRPKCCRAIMESLLRISGNKPTNSEKVRIAREHVARISGQ